MDKYKGQHLVINKAAGSYTHHGLGLGDGRVIHYSGLANDFSGDGVIEELSLDEFAKGKEIIIKAHAKRIFNTEDASLRASLRLGEAQYHVLHNNCEHLVEWCINGMHFSQQSHLGKLIYSTGTGVRTLVSVKKPMGFLLGAVAGYAYINHQGLDKIPDFKALEDAFNAQRSIQDIEVIE